MFLDKVNIENELFKLQNKKQVEKVLLKQVQLILEHDDCKRNKISNTLDSVSNKKENNFNFDLINSSNIYHISTIKSICIDYRLRFLDSNLFKSKIPEEAISKIRSLEKLHDTKLSGFKIIAPSKLFQLENADDPLLFAPIGNDYYYLIHKWGNDLNPFRKLMMLPFKNIKNIVITLILTSVITTMIMPIPKFGTENSNTIQFISFLFIFKSYCAIVLYYSFWKGKNFNTSIWNSKFYN